MTDDVRFSVLRRKLLAGLGSAAIRACDGLSGRLHPQALKKARAALWCRRSLHSTSMRAHHPVLGAALNGYSETGSWWYTQLILYWKQYH